MSGGEIPAITLRKLLHARLVPQIAIHVPQDSGKSQKTFLFFNIHLPANIKLLNSLCQQISCAAWPGFSISFSSAPPPQQDLVKNHLMYAVREEVEILKEQIKELAEKNNQLERENYLLKNLASPEQMEKFQSRIPADALLDNQSSHMGSDEQQTRVHCAGSAV